MDQDVTDTHVIVSLIESGPPGSPGTDNADASALAFGGRCVASISAGGHLRIYAQSPLREGDKVKICASFFAAKLGSSAPASTGAAPSFGAGTGSKPKPITLNPKPSILWRWYLKVLFMMVFGSKCTRVGH